VLARFSGTLSSRFFSQDLYALETASLSLKDGHPAGCSHHCANFFKKQAIFVDENFLMAILS